MKAIWLWHRFQEGLIKQTKVCATRVSLDQREITQ